MSYKEETVQLPGLPLLSDVPGGISDSEFGGRWYGLGVPDGWDENPQVRLITEEKARGDGDYAAVSRYHTSRNYVVQGIVETETWEELEAAEDVIKSVLSSGEPERMTVTRAGSSRYTYVLRASVPYVERYADTSLRFEIELYAPDPRKYGEEHSVVIPL